LLALPPAFRLPLSRALSAALPRPSTAEPIWRHREFVLALALVLLSLGIGMVRPDFLKLENLRDIMVNAAIPMVAAAGMTALIIGAQIDISIGAIMTVAAISVATLATRGWPVPALALVGVAMGAALGAVNGGLTAGLGIPSIVATLATVGAIRGALVLATHGDSVSVPEGLTSLGVGSFLGVPLPLWAAAAVAIGMALYLSGTRPGRQHYAVGSNPRATALSGIPVAWVTFRGFVLLGGLVGFAGFLFVCRNTPIYPSPPPGFELGVITAVVVGGTDIFGGQGTVLGTVLASLLLSAISVALTFASTRFPIPSETQPAIQGLLILVAVLYNSLARRHS
jgi:rhamnose transport system permease protein